MALSCGLLGLPNVGKSTLFNALTKLQIQAENYPFCTIEPNVGLVTVPDLRLRTLSRLCKPLKEVPAYVQFVDIAGLVEGASAGQGLGNTFLHHVREVDALCHIVRCFDDPDIVHVCGSVDPVRDAKIIEQELILSDLQTLEKSLEKKKKTFKGLGAEGKRLEQLYEELVEHLSNGKSARSFGKEIEDCPALLSAKPLLYIANQQEEGVSQPNAWVLKLQEYASQQGAQFLIINARFEAELALLEEADQKDFLELNGLTEPGLNRIIREAYKLLNLETFFTAGEKEVRAWTVTRNTLAPQAAGKIHSDFEKHFIRAEVVSFADYQANAGEQGAKQAGKWRLEGKMYVVQDGDVITFRVNA